MTDVSQISGSGNTVLVVTLVIDIELAYDCLRPDPLENSRSFRRLNDAVAELQQAAEKGERGIVTPLSAPPQVADSD